MSEVTIDGQRYAPVNEKEKRELEALLGTFSLEGTEHWRANFVAWDTKPNGERHGMYDDGDESAPFFSEAFLYNLLGKDEARSVLSIVRRLCVLAGVEYR